MTALVIHLPADRCPFCRASLFGNRMELLDQHVGRRGGWSLYRCLACHLEFRMYWPGLNRALVNRATQLARAYYGGHEGA